MVVAAVTNPLLGYDFLNNYELAVDCKNNTLLDNTTKQTAQMTLTSSVQTVQVEVPVMPDNVKEIFKKFPSLISPQSSQKPLPTTFYHHIDTASASPVFCRPRRLAEDRLAAAKQEFATLMSKGILQDSKSAWSSPIHFVPKSDGKFRIVGDYRALNSITVPDRYPIPNTNDLYNKLNGAQVFSKIDLLSAFYQIPVHPDDISKTAVTTPFGLYEFQYMPFGLRNASSTFQRFVDHIFRDFDSVFCYIDDILIFSKDEDSHLATLHKVFSKLEEYNLKISTTKCIFNVNNIDFLGCAISSKGVLPSSLKLKAISDFPPPADSKSLRRFLGMAGFYRKLVPKFAEIVLPLTERIRLEPKSKSIVLTESEKESFNKVIQTLANLNPLSFPSLQVSQYQLVTDASQFAVGAALHQMINNEPVPVGFFSKKLSQAQQKYSTFDRELLASYLSVLHFKHQIEGRDVLLLTDHKPLCSAFKSKTLAKSDRQQRHLSFLTEFINDISYIRGSENIVADYLSRPCNNLTLDVCDLPALAEQQSDDVEMVDIKDRLVPFQINENLRLFCDNSTTNPRPYVPTKSRKQIM